jgi:RNA polymerase sigma-70 factor (ECF subfamily)
VSQTAAPSELDDRALVDLVLGDGDESAFRVIYGRHTGSLYQFALRLMGGNEHDAEDVVQETWIRAVEKLATFRWKASLPLDERIDLEHAVAALPPGYRAVLVLHDIEGMTHQELAARLGVAVGTSKSQLARARAMLRSRLHTGEIAQRGVEP